MLFTADTNDGSSFVHQNCSALYNIDGLLLGNSNDTVTFECTDFGQLCMEDETNSGYVQTIGGVDYMVNSIAGGKYFLQGRYTSMPTGQPTGEPTSAPTSEPTTIPTSMPTGEPTGQPTGQPSSFPTYQNEVMVTVEITQNILNPAI